MQFIPNSPIPPSGMISKTLLTFGCYLQSNPVCLWGSPGQIRPCSIAHGSWEELAIGDLVGLISPGHLGNGYVSHSSATNLSGQEGGPCPRPSLNATYHLLNISISADSQVRKADPVPAQV